MAKNDERPRGKKTKAQALEDDALGLNGIERGRAQSAQPRPQAAPETPSSAATKEPSPGAMPDEIRERFIGIGAKYYFPDGAAAFTDHGAKLTTRSENTEVIRSLVAIAQAREWGEVKVIGTERFRKEAWFAARIAGLEVQGYEPSEFEQERLVRAIARREAAAGAAHQPPASIAEQPVSRDSDSPRPEKSGPIVGRLVDHGRAPYRHDPKASPSYYMRIETERGDREVWGVDLERAFRESLSRPTLGDEVTARAYGHDAVTVKTSEGEMPAHRNRWIVERSDFLAERAAAARVFRDPAVNAAQAVREHPELQGSYLQLQAAKLGAERDIRDSEDQARFVARARAAIADGIERGEPLEPVRMRERPLRTPTAEQTRDPEQTPTR
jgi:Large polyvalent protein-associated domain 7